MKNVCQDSLPVEYDLNTGYPEYEPGVLIT
jgi:hypothetical protein